MMICVVQSTLGRLPRQLFRQVWSSQVLSYRISEKVKEKEPRQPDLPPNSQSQADRIFIRTCRVLPSSDIHDRTSYFRENKEVQFGHAVHRTSYYYYYYILLLMLVLTLMHSGQRPSSTLQGAHFRGSAFFPSPYLTVSGFNSPLVLMLLVNRMTTPGISSARTLASSRP